MTLSQIPTRPELETYVQKHGVTFCHKSERWYMRWLGKLLGKAFRERFWTTLGHTVYVPDQVSDPYLYPVILAHELKHVEQHESWWILFGLLYLLLPLPVGLAWFRWKFEREGYMYSLWSRPSEDTIDWMVRTIWSSYAWPWPRFLMRRWFKRRLKEITP